MYLPLDTTTGAGDSAKAGGDKINAMFAELYTQGVRRTTLDKIKRALAASALTNPEVGGLAPGVTVTQSSTEDSTNFPRMVHAKAMFNNGVLEATGGQLYYSDTTTRAVITTNNLTGDSGNLGNTLANIIPTPPANENMHGPAYFRFGTDAPKLQIRYAATTSGTPIRIRVDGLYIDRTGWETNTNAVLTLDFAGVRKPRRIAVETNGSGQLFLVRMDNASRLFRPTPADPVRSVQYGDSHVQGGNPQASNFALGNSRIYADLTGVWDFRNAAVRSSGYVSAGSSGLLVPLSQTMDYSINQRTWDVVEFAAGFNDQSKTSAEIRTGALAAWRKARAAQPNALIVVWGVWGAASGPSASVVSVENTLKSAFLEMADPFSIFVPVSTASDPWETTANSAIFVEADGLHANYAGHEYRARMRDAGFRQAVSGLTI